MKSSATRRPCDACGRIIEPGDAIKAGNNRIVHGACPHPDEGLFEEPTRVPLTPGDEVVLLTMWGEEPCTVLRLGTESSFPMVKVRTESGDIVTVNRSSLIPGEGE